MQIMKLQCMDFFHQEAIVILIFQYFFIFFLDRQPVQFDLENGLRGPYVGKLYNIHLILTLNEIFVKYLYCIMTTRRSEKRLKGPPMS